MTTSERTTLQTTPDTRPRRPRGRRISTVLGAAGLGSALFLTGCATHSTGGEANAPKGAGVTDAAAALPTTDPEASPSLSIPTDPNEQTTFVTRQLVAGKIAGMGARIYEIIQEQRSMQEVTSTPVAASGTFGPGYRVDVPILGTAMEYVLVSRVFDPAKGFEVPANVQDFEMDIRDEHGQNLYKAFGIQSADGNSASLEVAAATWDEGFGVQQRPAEQMVTDPTQLGALTGQLDKLFDNVSNQQPPVVSDLVNPLG